MRQPTSRQTYLYIDLSFAPMRALLFLFALGLAACQKEAPAVVQIYKGPMGVTQQVQTIYSDSAQQRVVLTAPLQEEFATGNRVFPKGIKIFFYKQDPAKGTILESTLVADRGYFDKMTELYTGRGNVVVENVIEHKRLRSEELKWSRFEKRVYTDKFVRIETPEETLLGEGLTAAQDFSTYKILKPRGTLPANKL